MFQVFSFIPRLFSDTLYTFTTIVKTFQHHCSFILYGKSFTFELLYDKGISGPLLN